MATETFIRIWSHEALDESEVSAWLEEDFDAEILTWEEEEV